MSVPVCDFWFDTTIRRNRASYLGAVLVLGITLVVISFVVDYISIPSRLKFIIMLMFWVPCLLANQFLIAQRLRDLNISGWFAPMWFALVVADKELNGAATLAATILLVCVPGTKGANKYGDDPLSDATD